MLRPLFPSAPWFDDRLNKGGLTQALAMIQAVEEANRLPQLTRLGITLGYRIHDSCSDVSTALRASMNFTQDSGSSGDGGGGDCRRASGNSSERAQPVMAVLGASYSELSIALARLLTLELIPQVQLGGTGYGWNAGYLSWPSHVVYEIQKSKKIQKLHFSSPFWLSLQIEDIQLSSVLQYMNSLCSFPYAKTSFPLSK